MNIRMARPLPFFNIFLLGIVLFSQGCVTTDITKKYLKERCKLSYQEREAILEMEAEGLVTNDYLEFYCAGKRGIDKEKNLK